MSVSFVLNLKSLMVNYNGTLAEEVVYAKYNSIIEPWCLAVIGLYFFFERSLPLTVISSLPMITYTSNLALPHAIYDTCFISNYTKRYHEFPISNE